MADEALTTIPSNVSYVKLNANGVLELIDCAEPSVYINENQVVSLLDADTSDFIRKHYGPYVGVMHHGNWIMTPEPYATFKYILGA